MTPGELRDIARLLRPADEHPRLGIADEIVELGQGVVRIERHEDRAHRQDREIEDQGVRATCRP